MDSYINIRLKPDAEMSEAELSSKVYTKLHKAIAKLSTNQIGVSFPEVSVKLGRLFRLHSDASVLHDLYALEWLGPLAGYCQMSNVLSVPETVHYRVISHKRSNLSRAKLRRLIARRTIDKEGEKNYKLKMLSQGFDNPYLDLRSSSTEQVHRKFFEFGELLQQPVGGTFDSYGLSNTATVPWF